MKEDYYVTQDGRRWPKRRTKYVAGQLRPLFSIAAKLGLIKIEKK